MPMNPNEEPFSYTFSLMFTSVVVRNDFFPPLQFERVLMRFNKLGLDLNFAMKGCT